MIGTAVKPYHLLTKTTCKQRPVWIPSNQFWLINLQIATTSLQLALLWGPLGGRCTQVWLSFKIYFKSKIYFFWKYKMKIWLKLFQNILKVKNLHFGEHKQKYWSQISKKKITIVSVSGWKKMIQNAFVDKWNTAV